ncbi:Na+/H+ antiporter [Acetobacter nitrogenifigens DSM 23921 = NBRC 105050]|uniref:Sodium:proton antiporter n=1 Tax=Acetobacter nitrogenifigens DSM 23921 = NBRC 105050 TaxID=1120919 RepID=A0A511X6Q5_9PROT|nr:cation:proton antiporter [Acetobacter nitrogenifigens]GBQ98906.1 Na+/H+ antiporter [Acetobacter nitrogenifigens DSM 23921 = NBRC 105050]GEN58611.1 sodium:proton antiporter [Acetobacter nitrogenifigens DSM 23921 = NBRC 105050]
MEVTGLAAVLLAIALLLVIVSAVQPLARRLEVSETVLLAVVGIVIGGGADLVLRTTYTDSLSGVASNAINGVAETLLDFPVSSEVFLLIFLPVLVFQGAMVIDVRRLADETATVLLLAVVAVAVSTATIGLALMPFAQMPLIVCLLLGAIVATTDPSAVAGIFRDIGAASRLTRLVEGEALLNDAAAISIFSILLAAVTSHHAIHLGGAALSFVVSFAGATIIGIVGARLMLYMITALGNAPAAETTLTVALPYIVYILCDEVLGVSGVVATASAGLTLSVYGPSTFRPQTWRFLNELWQQLVFWAGSLVFVLASMLVPRLLIGMTRWDVVLILIASCAGLVARASVVFGMLPLLAMTRLAPPVPTPFKVTMVWGGLRGAITLALALAVTENPRVSTPVAHFVGIIATGFVLITLLVNGTTLRSLVLFFRLDQLSPIDQAMRHQVLGIALGKVAEQARETGEELGFSPDATGSVVSSLEKRGAEEQSTNTFDTALGDRQRVTLALITLANQERSILLDLFKIQGLSRRVMENLLRTSEAMGDGARLEGRFGYVRALRRRLSPSLRFRIAQEIHNRFHYDRPLMECMAERFEMLMVIHLVAISLMRFMRDRLEPTLGSRISEIVGETLLRQRKMLDEALTTLRLHYPGYSEALENRIFRQIVLRLESVEFDELHSESLISDELYRELNRDVELRKQRLGNRMTFNLKNNIEDRLRRAAVFDGLPASVIHDLAMTTSLRFTSPGEKIIRRGRKTRSVFFISAGLAEMHVAESDLRYGAGDLIGGVEALEARPMPGTVRTLQFSHMLTISASLFVRLVEEFPVIRENLEKLRSRTEDDAVPAIVHLEQDFDEDSPPGEAAVALLNEPATKSDEHHENATWS